MGKVKKDVVMMKTKQRAVIAVAVIVLLAAAILGAKPMYNLCRDISFRQVARFAQENGYYSRGSGSSWTLISEGSGQLGVKATEIPLVKKKMIDALEAGKPIICAMREGDFTTTGHYIVLRGVENGEFQVNDPNSVVNSEKLWSYEQIEGQIRNLWVMEKA